MQNKIIRRAASRSIPSQRQIRNWILLRLPPADMESILSELKFVELPTHTVIAEAGRPIKFAYFIDEGLASVLAVMSNGKSVEVGLAGKEGFVGTTILAGFESSATRVVMQVGGSGYQIGVLELKKLLVREPRLQMALTQQAQRMTLQAEQIAACNRLHGIRARLARWLLMSQDRLGGSVVPLTQQYLSHMLGTRRAGVSAAAGLLQKNDIISYSRGRVTIRNRRKLEAASCECYEKIERQLERWEAESK
jgi:CRP-like cAMP-binding protein